jgi:hypothetical protein
MSITHKAGFYIRESEGSGALTVDYLCEGESNHLVSYGPFQQGSLAGLALRNGKYHTLRVPDEMIERKSEPLKTATGADMRKVETVQNPGGKEMTDAERNSVWNLQMELEECRRQRDEFLQQRNESTALCVKLSEFIDRIHDPMIDDTETPYPRELMERASLIKNSGYESPVMER